jgi:GH15 family glucan-1,4-alpha-glucosidase
MRYAHGNEQKASAASGVDSSELFIFSRFLDGELGPDIEHKTFEEIVASRFGSNELPTRYPGDVYFTGGRWLLLGLECANYLARKGDRDAAERKIFHVLEQHFDSMPEQVLVDPESPNHEAGIRDLERNNGETIKELEWSYAEYVEAVLSLVDPGMQNAGIIRLKTD